MIPAWHQPGIPTRREPGIPAYRPASGWQITVPKQGTDQEIRAILDAVAYVKNHSYLTQGIENKPNKP